MSDFVQLYFEGAPAPGAGRRLVCFVHGGAGDHRTTWTGKRDTYWPSLVHADADFGGPDVAAVDYDTHAKSWSPDVQDIASELRAALLEQGADRYQAVTFVAHSLGGIVVRWMLCDDVLRYGAKLWPRTRLVMSFSSPYEGCNGVSLVKHVMLQSDQVKSVVPPSPMLDALAAEWRSVLALPGRRPVIRCAWEDPPVKTDWFMREESATFLCDSPSLAIRENHRNIVKPDGAAHVSHEALRNEYRASVLAG